MPNVNEPGTYRAEIEEYVLQDSKSSDAVAIKCKFRTLEKKNGDEWLAYKGMHVYGYAWIIGKDGKVNQKAQESFMNATGWDGDLDSIYQGTFEPYAVSIEVESEQYAGKDGQRKIAYKVAWINHYNDEGGGGLKGMDPAKSESIIEKYRQAMKASAAAINESLGETPGDRAEDATEAVTESTDGCPF